MRSGRGQRTADADGGNCDKRDQHRRSEPIYAGSPPILGNAMSEDDIEHEKGTVGKGEDNAQWLSTKAHLGQQPSSSRRQ